MNINSLIRRISKFNDEETINQVNMTIGILTKRKRIELGLTQSDVAKSICSVSYLSKVESNKINPNPRCVELLMEKVKIPRWEIYVLENGPELLKKSLLHLYNLNADSYNELYNEVKDVKDNHTVDIIKLGYSIMNASYNDTQDIINEGIHLVNSMDKDSVNIFALYVGEYYLHVSNFEDALEIQKALEPFSYGDNILAILINDFSFRLFAKVKRPLCASNMYHKLEGIYAKSIQITRLRKLKMEYAEMLFNEGEYKEVIKILDSIEDTFVDTRKEKYYALLGASYYRLKKEFKAKEYLDFISPYSESFKLVVNEKYQIEENKEAFLEEVIRINESKPNIYLELLICKQKDTVSRELFESEVYIKAFIGLSIYEMIYLYNEQREYMMSISKYKDSCIIANKIKNLIKNYRN